MVAHCSPYKLHIVVEPADGLVPKPAYDLVVKPAGQPLGTVISSGQSGGGVKKPRLVRSKPPKPADAQAKPADA